MRLLGESFTAARMATLLVSLVCVYLFHRILLLVGLTLQTATVTTLALALSPIYLALSLNYMTDLYGLFGLILALYCCLHALRARTQMRAITWILFAVGTNAIAGTARQTAWLGVLVMVPTTLWLMRRSHRLLVWGVIAELGALAFIMGAVHWLSHQPYAVPESLLPRRHAPEPLVHVVLQFFRATVTLGLLLLPMTLGFVVVVWRRELYRQKRSWIAVSLAAAVAWLLERSRAIGKWTPPFTRDSWTPRGMFDLQVAVMGQRPTVVGPHTQLILLLLTAIGVAAVLMLLVQPDLAISHTVPPTRDILVWRDLLALVGLPLLSYCALLVPRGATATIFDRYMLVPQALLLIPLARLYESQSWAGRLPRVTVVIVGLVGVWSVAAAHDVFALYRGLLAATNEVRAAGVPRSAITSTWEYNRWTQLEKQGYTLSLNERLPDGTIFGGQLRHPPLVQCPDYDFYDDASPPALYRLSFVLRPCMVRTAFAPVVYHTWLPPRTTSIYIVRYPPDAR